MSSYPSDPNLPPQVFLRRVSKSPHKMSAREIEFNSRSSIRVDSKLRIQPVSVSNKLANMARTNFQPERVDGVGEMFNAGREFDWIRKRGPGIIISTWCMPTCGAKLQYCSGRPSCHSQSSIITSFNHGDISKLCQYALISKRRRPTIVPNVLQSRGYEGFSRGHNRRFRNIAPEMIPAIPSHRRFS